MYNELARTIKGHTKEVMNDFISSVGLEFGTITNAGLKLDSFKYEIKDYYVLEYLTMKADYFTNTTITDHSHSVNTPEQLKPLKAGDRVLVATVGKEFVVVGRIANVQSVS